MKKICEFNIHEQFHLSFRTLSSVAVLFFLAGCKTNPSISNQTLTIARLYHNGLPFADISYPSRERCQQDFRDFPASQLGGHGITGECLNSDSASTSLPYTAFYVNKLTGERLTANFKSLESCRIIANNTPPERADALICPNEESSKRFSFKRAGNFQWVHEYASESICQQSDNNDKNLTKTCENQSILKNFPETGILSRNEKDRWRLHFKSKDDCRDTSLGLSVSSKTYRLTCENLFPAK